MKLSAVSVKVTPQEGQAVTVMPDSSRPIYQYEATFVAAVVVRGQVFAVVEHENSEIGTTGVITTMSLVDLSSVYLSAGGTTVEVQN